MILIRLLTGGTIRAARRDAENLRQKATAEAEAAQRKAELEIERMLVERREALEHELDDARQQIKKDQGSAPEPGRHAGPEDGAALEP